jgi:acyl carrier protein
MHHSSIQQDIVDFLRSVTGQPSIDADTDLFEAGVTDSLTMMDLLVFLETEFQLRLDFADLNPDVFKTASSLADLIGQRLATSKNTRAA